MTTSFRLSFQRNFDGLRSVHAELAPFRDSGALLDHLHRKKGDPARKNQVLSALIRAAQDAARTSDCAVTLLLLALWPGLDVIRRRSIWRRLGDAEEIGAEVLARATELILRLDLCRVNRIAATVLRNIERDLIRDHKRAQARVFMSAGLDPDAIMDSGDAGIGAAGYARLTNAVQRLLGDDAPLVIRVAIEGVSQAEAGAELGLSEAAARKRFQRAMRRLFGFVDQSSDFFVPICRQDRLFQSDLTRKQQFGAQI